MSDYIKREDAQKITAEWLSGYINDDERNVIEHIDIDLGELPPADVVEVVRCKDCKHWRQQTNYQGVPLSFGFCESDDMWRSLRGETYEVSHIDTDDDFYCSFGERADT